MTTTETIQKVDGRSRQARAARAAARSAQQPIDPEPVRRHSPRTDIRPEPVREPMRAATRGGTVARGRNGEILTRKRSGSTDPFHIDAKIIPDGWEYQWNAVTIIGNGEVLMDQNLRMAENGWRPVPADRHPGQFMPAGHAGSILRGGQRLDERPKILSDEARAEDLAAARQLISDRNDALMLKSVRKNLGDGFEMGRKYRGTGGDLRMSIDKALDIPAPSHQLANPGDE